MNIKIIFFTLSLLLAATATAKKMEVNNRSISESKAAIDPAEKRLRLVDYSNCYFVANNYPSDPSEWNRMCSMLESNLGEDLKGACYRLPYSSSVTKKGFCYNFNH